MATRLLFKATWLKPALLLALLLLLTGSSWAQVTVSGGQFEEDPTHTPAGQIILYDSNADDGGYWSVSGGGPNGGGCITQACLGSTPQTAYNANQVYVIWAPPAPGSSYTATLTYNPPSTGNPYTPFCTPLTVTVVECSARDVNGATSATAIEWNQISTCSDTRSATLNTNYAITGLCYFDDYNTTAYPASHGQPSPDAYYHFQLAVSTQVQVSTAGSAITPYLHLVAASDQGQELAYGTNSISQVLPSGSYYLIVEGNGSASGTINISGVFQQQITSSSFTYITTQTPQVEGLKSLSDVAGATATQVMRSTTYLDGLGRPLQVVDRQASPDGHDVVTSKAYDEFGREAIKYLPYADVAATDGNYKSDALCQGGGTSAQRQFYATGWQTGSDRVAHDAAPFMQTVFEASPLNRAVQQGAAGQVWQPDAAHPSGSDNHASKSAIRLNTGTAAGEDNVLRWTYTVGNAQPISVTASYGANQLSVTESTDEHNVKAWAFTDAQGHVVLKRDQTAATASTDTYYLYDDLGLLRAVIPPMGSAEVRATGASAVTAAFLTKWCFIYDYDSRQRLIRKQLPGGVTEETVYNLRDQAVLHRSSQVKDSGLWLFTKYDALGRVVMTGRYESEESRETEQSAAINASLAQWESVVPASTAGQLKYTLTNSYPTDIGETSIDTRTYYDTYAFSDLASTSPVDRSFKPEAGVNSTDYSTNTVGLVTGRAELMPGNFLTAANTWLITSSFYNDRGQPIQTQTDLFPSGTERLTTKVDFTGRVLSSLQTHDYPSNSSALKKHTILQGNTYDQVGRLQQISQQIDAQPTIILAQYEYNEVGQLVDKKLHSADNGISFLQSVDYRYNIRGWLTNINNRALSNNQWLDDTDPNSDNLGTNDLDSYNANSPHVDPDLFGFELKYNDRFDIGLPSTLAQPHVAQYNGNIATAMWKTRNDRTGQILRAYAYSYDPLNRLREARYRTYEWSSAANAYQWNVYSTDFSASSTYDDNGNITHLTRQGVQIVNAGTTPATTTPILLDDLTYAYSTTDGNRLSSVTDAVTNSAPVHDFEDNGSKGTGEYGYDAGGNMSYDGNKQMDVVYNLQNLPQYVDVLNTEYPGDRNHVNQIYNIYSSSGVKVAKVTKKWMGVGNPWLIKTTYYAGSYVYEEAAGTKALSFVGTPEGRMLYTESATPYAWKYEYHLKDHLGNLRFAFRADKENGTVTQLTGMEPANAVAEEQAFTHVAETRLADPDRARSGQYVARLNAHQGRRDGPTITFSVVAGDSIRAEAYGRYDRGTVASSFIPKAALIAGAAVTTVPGVLGTDQRQPQVTRQNRLPFIGLSLAIVPQLLSLHKAKVPTAYLRYELFNKDSQLIATHIQALQRTATDEWQKLQVGTKVDSTGYVRMSLVNESDVPAYFDDMLVAKVAPPPLQENHYDPFGLNLVGIESTGTSDSKFQFNGKEKQDDFGQNWVDYGARMLDPQLGRWHSVDPLAETSRRWSPYALSYDNPIRFIDPDGMQVTSYGEHFDGAEAEKWFEQQQKNNSDPSTDVQRNGDSSYTVTGAKNDGDNNVYVNQNGKRTGEVIATTLRPYDFMTTNDATGDFTFDAAQAGITFRMDALTLSGSVALPNGNRASISNANAGDLVAWGQRLFIQDLNNNAAELLLFYGALRRLRTLSANGAALDFKVSLGLSPYTALRVGGNGSNVITTLRAAGNITFGANLAITRPDAFNGNWYYNQVMPRIGAYNQSQNNGNGYNSGFPYFGEHTYSGSYIFNGYFGRFPR